MRDRLRAAFILTLTICLFLGAPAQARRQTPPPDPKDQPPAQQAPRPADETQSDEGRPPAGPGGDGQNVATMSDVHDIKPPEKIGVNPKMFYYAGAALLALFLIAALALLWRRIRARRGKTPAAAPSLSPEERAVMMLDELREVEQIDGKEFYFRLSLILREYIRDRFGFNAPEMTTEELLPKIEDLDADRKMRQELKDLCRSSDPVKFAGVPAVVKQMAADLAVVRRFVKAAGASADDKPAAA